MGAVVVTFNQDGKLSMGPKEVQSWSGYVKPEVRRRFEEMEKSLTLSREGNQIIINGVGGDTFKEGFSVTLPVQITYQHGGLRT